LLGLDEPIQQLLIERRLTLDTNVFRALMKLPEQSTRLKLAHRFARLGSSGRQMRKAIDHVIRQYQKIEDKPNPKPIKTHKVVKPTTGNLDAAAVMKIAENTLCEGCRLEGLKEECWVCPGPYDFVNALVEKAEFQLKKEAEK